MSQPLPYNEIQFDKNGNVEGSIKTPDESNIGYFAEVDLSYRDNKRQKTKHFSFARESKKNLVLMISVIINVKLSC